MRLKVRQVLNVCWPSAQLQAENGATLQVAKGRHREVKTDFSKHFVIVWTFALYSRLRLARLYSRLP